jgi:hypothetical protein
MIHHPLWRNSATPATTNGRPVKGSLRPANLDLRDYPYLPDDFGCPLCGSLFWEERIAIGFCGHPDAATSFARTSFTPA